MTLNVMINKYLDSIIKKRQTCYFISPHFDDAVFSAGALMTYLAKHTSVTVINIFTKASRRPYTLSAEMFLRQCGYRDAQKLFADRGREDADVFKSINVKVINLSFSDALWRKKDHLGFLARFFSNIGELSAVYPTYKLHAIKGKIAKADMDTVAAIKNELKAKVSEKNSVVFCPLGIGSHVDHVIARKVCDELFRDVIHWSDFPYNEKSQKNSDGLKSFVFAEGLSDKRKLIEGYKSQYGAMFHAGLKLRPEEFFYK
jgi:LmbE family N-acetylglucosaminyl deacetylase